MKNVVFFSKNEKDVYSPELLKIFDMLPFKNEIVYFCVDPDKVTKKCNDELLRILEIEEVPTIIINNETMVGEAAFRWARMQLRALMDDGEEMEQEEEEEYVEQEEVGHPVGHYVDSGHEMEEPAPRRRQSAMAALPGYDAGSGPAPFNPASTGAAGSQDVALDLLRPHNTKMKGACHDMESRLKQYAEDRQGEAPEPVEPPRRRRRARN